MEEIIISDTADFEAKLAAAGDTCLALFKGSTDPATGESWCDDCERADPFINAAKPKGTHPLLIVYVGLRDEWKEKPENPWRTHVKT